jgi:hypothetical protein
VRAASDYQRIGIGVAGGLEERFFDGSGANTHRGIRADGLLKFGDTAKGFALFNGLDFFLKIELEGRRWFTGLDGMDDGEPGMHLGGGLGGESKDSF